MQPSANGSASALVLYTLSSGQYEKIIDFGLFPVWLSDNRRLLFLHQGKLYLVDSQSKRVHEVLSVAPHSVSPFALSRDDRLIYFTLESTEADIWLLALE